MSELQERRVVACPYHIAREHLAVDLGNRAGSKTPNVLTLHAPLAGAAVTKNVLVTIATADDPMHFDQPWKVHWTPEGGGPYPDFDGTLTVRADEDYHSSVLELRGDYRPPGGIVGAAFDLAVGSKIASATARTLLDEIASVMESSYAAAERAKHSGPSGGGS
ncbi:MAG TPA: hypothetical protein VMF61_08660 [Candidatus Acidoferrales bacterium]|nr:hypothetical protein [Candidatus Acidoferrales bacterium]